MRRAHRMLLLQGIAVAAVVWMSLGPDAVAKTKKKPKPRHGKHHHPAATASASASEAPSSTEAPASTSSAYASASPEPASSAPPEISSSTSAGGSSSAAETGPADTGAGRPTARDVMLEGVGGLLFGAVPLLGGSAGLLALGGQTGDQTPGYVALGALTYTVFIPMTALGVAFAGNLLDVHGTYLGALLGSAIGTAVAAAPTAVLVYEGTRGSAVDGVEVMSSLFALPMVLGTVGAVVGWELSVGKQAPKAAGLRRWIVPGFAPSRYGSILTLTGAF